MDKSQTPGEHSSHRKHLEFAEATRLLSDVANSEPVKRVKDAFGESAQLFLVGGLVRDAFLGELGADIDIATSLPVSQTLNLCKAAAIRTVETGVQHGTVLAVIDETHIEITSFRKPSDRTSHTLAGTIHEDLGGRDFTINALAFDIHSYSLVDPYGGLEDLKNDIVRAVGTATARFSEDPLRLLRLFRFGPAQGRTIETETRSAAKELASQLGKIARERIKAELDRILMGDGAAAFREMQELGMLAYTVPELIPAVGCEQNEFHIHDVFEHTMWVLSRCPSDLILRWSAIFHDVGKPHTISVDENGRRHFYGHEVVSAEQGEQRMEALKFSNDDRNRITSIVRHHMRPVNCGPSGIRRLLRDLGDEFERWFLFKYADATPTIPEGDVRRAMEEFRSLVDMELERRRKSDEDRLAIDGNDILSLGVPAGPKVGFILKALQERVIEAPEINEREMLLQLAQEMITAIDISPN